MCAVCASGYVRPEWSLSWEEPPTVICASCDEADGLHLPGCALAEYELACARDAALEKGDPVAWADELARGAA